jgi:hypothetical protein
MLKQPSEIVIHFVMGNILGSFVEHFKKGFLELQIIFVQLLHHFLDSIAKLQVKVLDPFELVYRVDLKIGVFVHDLIVIELFEVKQKAWSPIINHTSPLFDF